jgi:hypothetical protein
VKPTPSQVAAASSGLAESRAASVAACRAMESSLVAALEQSGEHLRGLEDLGPRGAHFRAARVRGGIDAPLDIPSGAAGTPRLCIDDRGRLVMACVVRHGAHDLGIQWNYADDADLMAEDGAGLAAVLDEVLATHLAAVERQRERYAGLRRVAEAITAGLALRGAK